MSWATKANSVSILIIGLVLIFRVLIPSYTNEFRSLGVGIVSEQKADPTPMFFTELPCLIDIQKKLNELEPNNPIPVDGRWGKLTYEKWERVYCNEQAKKYF